MFIEELISSILRECGFRIWQKMLAWIFLSTRLKMLQKIFSPRNFSPVPVTSNYSKWFSYWQERLDVPLGRYALDPGNAYYLRYFAQTAHDVGQVFAVAHLQSKV